MASDVGSRQCPTFHLRALFVVAGELTLGTIRRCGRYMTLAALFHFRSTPDHSNSCVLLAMAGELVLGTVCRCGWFGVLAARLRFGSAADLELSHVRFLLYIWGSGVLDFLLLFLGPSCHCILCAVDPVNFVELRACTRVQVSVGSLTVVASPAAPYCQVGSLPPYLVLFKVLIG